MLHAQLDAGVVAQRTNGAFRPSETFPWAAGVDVFFVISGFIMVHASGRLFGATGGRRIFLSHRVARVVPLYWAVTTLYVAVAMAVPALINRGELTPGYVLASYLFIPVEGPDGHVLPVYGLGWTLNYEMFFYGLFALALGLGRSLAVSAVTVVLLVLVAAGRVVPLPQPLAFWTDPILLEFAFGMALALAREHGLRLGWATALALAAAALALLAIDLGRPGAPLWLPRVLAYGLPAALLVAAAALRPGGETRTGPLTRLAVAVGDASYALYLLHPFVIRAGREAMLAGGLAAVVGPWGFVAFSLALASGAALVVHRLFERPLTAWTRRRLEGTRASLSDRSAVDYAHVGAGSPAAPDTDTRASP